MFYLESNFTDAGRSGPLKALADHRPRNIMLMVHTSCNLACDYCYEVVSGFHYSSGRMTFQQAQKVLDHYLNQSGSRRRITVTFFGGEPLLNYDVIVQCVAYLRSRDQAFSKDIGFSITTNATLLTDSIIQFLVEHKFIVMLSIDGAPEKADTHRKDHGGRGATALAIANGLKLITAQRLAGVREASVRATLTAENNSRHEVHKFLSGLGFSRIIIGAAERRPYQDAHDWEFNEGHMDDTATQDAVIDEYLAWTQGREPSASSRISGMRQAMSDLGRSLDSPQLPPALGCGVGSNMLAYSAKGDVYPCHRFAGDANFVLGNVNNGGASPGLLDKFYSDILDARNKVCGGCWARLVCKGRCPWTFARQDGSIGSPDNKACDILRGSFERHLWLWTHPEVRNMVSAASDVQDED
jgi:uncharacterized protein